MALVSVVTATWQRWEQLVRAVRSVDLQTLQPIEQIVVADGPETLPLWQGRIGLPELRLVELGRNWRSFRGVESRGADPRMVGAMLARGDYIAYLDDDNEWLPVHLETVVAELERTGADFATSQALRDDGRVIGDGILGLGHVDTNLLVHRATCLLHGNWIAIQPPYDDWDLMRRWQEAGLRWVHVPVTTVLYHH